jgi:hypothetical protein
MDRVDARKWFTGPKITLSGEDLTEEQQAAIRDEGLHIEGIPDGSVEAGQEKGGRTAVKTS